MPVEGALSAVPEGVRARLGRSAEDLSRLGSSRVLRGNGLVLKAGPADRAAREAFVLGRLHASLPLRVPELVDAGEGWLLFTAENFVEPMDARSARVGSLSDLARMHEAFAGTPTLEDERLRDVAGRELPDLLARCREAASGIRLDGPLQALASDPEPLLLELRTETTLVHGDAWPGNVLHLAGGGRSWIDWEEAGSGHAALDVATWCHGSPWVPPAPDPDGDLAAYLEARSDGLAEAQFRRAVDAAVVLLFLLLDLPTIARWRESDRDEVTAPRAAVARPFA